MHAEGHLHETAQIWSPLAIKQLLICIFIRSKCGRTTPPSSSVAALLHVWKCVKWLAIQADWATSAELPEATGDSFTLGETSRSGR